MNIFKKNQTSHQLQMDELTKKYYLAKADKINFFPSDVTGVRMIMFEIYDCTLFISLQ